MFKLFGSKDKKESLGDFEVKNFASGSFYEQILFGGTVSSNKTSQFYRESSAVAIAVDTIASEIEGISPVVKMRDGTLLDTHPVLDLLKNPNEFEDYREFIGRLSRQYLLNHDAFVYAEGGITRPPLNIFAVANQNVNATPDGVDGYPSSFMINTGFGIGHYSRLKKKGKISFIDGALKEIYHIHGYSSRSDNVYADSPLEAAALEIRQQLSGSKHNLKIIDNGGRLSMAVILKDKPDVNKWHDIERSIQEKFSGSENAGRIAVVSSPEMDIKELGQSNKDMDFTALDSKSKESIFTRYRIPLPIISSDRQTYGNFDRAIEDLYDRSVLPYTKVLFSGLTKLLKKRYGDSFEEITFNQEDISALKSRMMNQLQTRREINIETVNELRESIPNRNPIDGGDIYYQSATLIPVGEDMIEDEEVDVDEVVGE